jgi:hypothetical protein
MTDSAIYDNPGERFTARRRRDDNRSAIAASRSVARAKAEFAQYRTSPWTNAISLISSSAVIAVLWVGWLDRDNSSLTPESGAGYWLGIAGGVLMLLLLVYPLRKRMRRLRVIGTVPFWFRAHMILGGCGSVLVLWHANFKLGSINSSVALVAMLVVAASGIFGRYLYSRVHLGLYGRKAVVREILADAETLRRRIGDSQLVANHVLARLDAFARLGMAAPKGALAGLVLLPLIGWRGSAIRARLISDARRMIALEGQRRGWSRRLQRQQLADVADLVTLHVAAVKKAAAFAFYERVFRLWHLFHVPLFILLVIATVVHVYAAHFF